MVKAEIITRSLHKLIDKTNDPGNDDLLLFALRIIYKPTAKSQHASCHR